MKFVLKRVLAVVVISALVVFVARPLLCEDTVFHTSGTEAMERRVAAFLKERVASQRDIDSIDGVPDLDQRLEDVLAPPLAPEGNVLTQAAAYVMSLWEWVTSIPDKFRSAWNWNDAQSAEYRDRLFVSAASTAEHKDWNRSRYLNIVQSAAIVDCATAPNACRGEEWYMQRTTGAWRRAVSRQIDELCPDGAMRQVMCGHGTCGMHAAAAKGRAWRAATQVHSVERLHDTLHWFVDRYKDGRDMLKNLKDGLPDWVTHPIRSMQEHYDGQGELEGEVR